MLSAAAAVVVMFLGPAVDHHFAERQHEHTHIYLTISAAEHGHPESHPFEGPHAHTFSGIETAGHDDVIYQTSNDGLGDSASVSIAALIDVSPGLQNNGDFLAHALTTGGSEFRKAFVAHPKRPPRV